MLLHGDGGGGVARKHETADSLIGAKRALDAFKTAKIHATKSPNRPDEIFINLHQRSISGEPHDEQVQTIEHVCIRVCIICGITESAQSLAELGPTNRRHALHQKFDGKDLERDANFVNLLNVLRRDCPYGSTAVRHDYHEPLVL